MFKVLRKEVLGLKPLQVECEDPVVYLEVHELVPLTKFRRSADGVEGSDKMAALARKQTEVAVGAHPYEVVRTRTLAR